ncbi:zinc finger protein 318 [Bombina bombina]|uniref:zinc finger protein 318 n=1 Tax=Bombina bombina TaxID=8345 RepID=UPI00235AE0C4|nr:zinc finger protein 318 [Bombina bombina]
MYRTPMRRDPSPDQIVDTRYQSPDIRAHSTNRWSRSPSNRSCQSPTRGRSPVTPRRRSPSRGRSSPSRRRSASRGRRRSRSRDRSSSRDRSPKKSHRSKSRPRRSPSRSRRSRSRHRRSPTKYWSRSPSEDSQKRRYDTRYDNLDSVTHHYSPSFLSGSADNSVLSQQKEQADRFADLRPASSGYQECLSEQTRFSDEPMPKSILKRRPDADHSLSPQVDSYTGNGRLMPGNSSSKSLTPENNTRLPETNRTSNLLPQDKLGSSKEEPLKGGLASSKYSPQMGNFLNMFNKSACESQGIPYHSPRSFDSKVVSPQESETPINVSAGQKQPSNVSTVPDTQDKAGDSIKGQENKLPSQIQIEDEEKFLYGDEDVKKAHSNPGKIDKSQTPSPSHPKGSTNKQEFEKIHDLLKTIGLDIGVAEIGKLAIRTQERLHGKKATPLVSKQAAERRCSGSETSSADSRLQPSGSPILTEKKEVPVTSQATPEPPANPVSVTAEEKISAVSKPKAEIPVATTSAQQIATHPGQAPAAQPPPVVAPPQMPLYPPYPPTQMMPTYSMPPSMATSYNPYNPYAAYQTARWPMYNPIHQPPPPMSLPPPTHMVTTQSPVVSATSTATYQNRSNLRVIHTSDSVSTANSTVKNKSLAPLSSAPAVNQSSKESTVPENDPKNKDSEKRKKVLEDLQNIVNEQKIRKQKLYSLNSNVEQLRVQQGILLRKKRREKDGHKDPLLEELNKVMESAVKQMNNMRKEFNEASKKQQQLTVVAEILGLSTTHLTDNSSELDLKLIQENTEILTKPTEPSKDSVRETKSSSDVKDNSKPNAESKDTLQSSNNTYLPSSSSSREKLEETSKLRTTPPQTTSKNKHSSESKSSSSSHQKSRSKSPRPSEKSSKSEEAKKSFDVSQLFSYFDPGDHWCEDCNSTCKTLFEFLTHMHAKKHSQTVNQSKRPWAKNTEKDTKTEQRTKMSVPVRGPEFLIPINGFYCQLCDEIIGDHMCAEEHLRAFAHNDKYKKYVEVNGSYEQRRHENHKAGLLAIQEAERRQKLEQKRKLDSQIADAYNDQKYKKTRREEEDSQKKHSSNVATKPDSMHSPPKEREDPAKTQIFGKFTWKGSNNKAGGGTSKDESAATTPERDRESGKGNAVKPKSIDIKLMGKPPVSQESSKSPSSSSPTVTTSTTSFTSHTKVRPNLPIPVSVLRKSSIAPLSKPAPLNTFLSIKSSKSIPKPLPVVKSETALSREVISKAFGGQAIIVRETNEVLKMEDKNKPGTQQADGPSKNQAALSGSSKFSPKSSNVETKFGPSTPSGVDKLKTATPTERDVRATSLTQAQKASPISKNQVTAFSNSSTTDKLGIKPSSEQNRQVISARTAASVTMSSESATGKQPQDLKAKENDAQKSLENKQISGSNKKVTEIQSRGLENKQISGSNTKGTEIQSRGLETKQISGSNTKGTEIQSRGFENKQISGSNTKGTEIQSRGLENKQISGSNTKGTEIQSRGLENKEISGSNKKATETPGSSAGTLSTAKQDSSYSNTVKLNQKFKRAPLSLPSTLFGHMSDAGRKDINISAVVQSSNNNKEVQLKDNKAASNTSNTTTEKTHLQQELDSYYKLIATEDDPEDLTTSEDQDMDVTENISIVSVPIKVGVPKISSVTVKDICSSKPDAEVACENAPEASSALTCAGSSVPVNSSQVVGNFSYGTQKSPVSVTSNSKVGEGVAEQGLSKKEQGHYTETQYSMEDLAYLTTCDSD